MSIIFMDEIDIIVPNRAVSKLLMLMDRPARPSAHVMVLAPQSSKQLGPGASDIGRKLWLDRMATTFDPFIVSPLEADAKLVRHHRAGPPDEDDLHVKAEGVADIEYGQPRKHSREVFGPRASCCSSPRSSSMVT